MRLSGQTYPRKPVWEGQTEWGWRWCAVLAAVDTRAVFSASLSPADHLIELRQHDAL